MPDEVERSIVWGLQKSYEQAQRGKRRRSEKTLRKLVKVAKTKAVRVDRGTAVVVAYLVKSAMLAEQGRIADRIAEVRKGVEAAQAKVRDAAARERGI